MTVPQCPPGDGTVPSPQGMTQLLHSGGRPRTEETPVLHPSFTQELMQHVVAPSGTKVHIVVKYKEHWLTNMQRLCVRNQVVPRNCSQGAQKERFARWEKKEGVPISGPLPKTTQNHQGLP